ncbi:hypothetical protein BpHYR1_022208 [Brachionus plicatilis]|uniref:Uncharacterized protein n=1 Tax=Brachionus plicatilis TaxID=10195 RepID=A0A3M7S1E0_BRAPC|nr:hypothetical protein BpHYR1_022208 [Brachionus plicatilis]
MKNLKAEHYYYPIQNFTLKTSCEGNKKILFTCLVKSWFESVYICTLNSSCSNNCFSASVSRSDHLLGGMPAIW